MLTFDDAMLVARAAVEVALLGQTKADTKMQLEALPHNPDVDDDLEDRLCALVTQV
jgi:hypothetical protein